MKDIIDLIRQRLDGARLDDCISPSTHKEVMELVDKLAQLQQHGVMQAEGSDGVSGEAVASSAVGKGVCEGLHKGAYWVDNKIYCPSCDRIVHEV